jgi:hypothetical protein
VLFILYPENDDYKVYTAANGNISFKTTLAVFFLSYDTLNVQSENEIFGHFNEHI